MFVDNFYVIVHLVVELMKCEFVSTGSYSLFKTPFRLYKKLERERERETRGRKERRTNELTKGDICARIYRWTNTRE